jgi:hypothetical protein
LRISPSPPSYAGCPVETGASSGVVAPERPDTVTSIVYADEKSADAAAISEFEVREDMRRLIVRPTHD